MGNSVAEGINNNFEEVEDDKDIEDNEDEKEIEEKLKEISIQEEKRKEKLNSQVQSPPPSQPSQSTSIVSNSAPPTIAPRNSALTVQSSPPNVIKQENKETQSKESKRISTVPNVQIPVQPVVSQNISNISQTQPTPPQNQTQIETPKKEITNQQVTSSSTEQQQQEGDFLEKKIKEELLQVREKVSKLKKKNKKLKAVVQEKTAKIEDYKKQIKDQKRLIKKFYSDLETGKYVLKDGSKDLVETINKDEKNEPNSKKNTTEGNKNDSKKEEEKEKKPQQEQNVTLEFKRDSRGEEKRNLMGTFTRLERKYMQSLKAESNRNARVKEFFLTEKRYVENLSLLQTQYIYGIREKKLIKEEKVFNEIFNDFEVILETNRTFLRNLEDGLFTSYQMDEQLVDLVLNFSENFKQYSNYIKNYAESHKLLIKEIKKNKKLENFLNETAQRLMVLSSTAYGGGGGAIGMSGNAGGMETSISAIMIQPVQRLPRYALLLKDLLKHTKKESKQAEKLAKAIEGIEEILVFCNKESKEHENKLYLMELEKKLGMTLIQKKLFFSSEDIIIVDNNFRESEGSMFVFNDSLVVKEIVENTSILGKLMNGRDARIFKIPLVSQETILIIPSHSQSQTSQYSSLIEICDPEMQQLAKRFASESLNSSRLSSSPSTPTNSNRSSTPRISSTSFTPTSNVAPIQSGTSNANSSSSSLDQFSVRIKFLSFVEREKCIELFRDFLKLKVVVGFPKLEQDEKSNQEDLNHKYYEINYL